MADQRPAFRHTPEKRGLIGPFSGRQLLVAFGAVVVAIIGLTIATTPLSILESAISETPARSRTAQT